MNSWENVKPIAVAVDGSDDALAAVRWAAAEAVRRGRRLRVMHAYEWPLPAYGPGFGRLEILREAAERIGIKKVRHAVTLAKQVAPGLAVETELVLGSAARVLQKLSEQACLIVTGSRGLGGFTGLIAGSVAVALAAHAHCPVVVVRGTEPDPHGPIVVGVDGSAASEAAVALAFDEASVRGCGLVAVHSWSDIAFPYIPEPGWPVPIDWEPVIAREKELLAERLAGWCEKYPDVTVERIVHCDRPARALLDAARDRDARLIVVGSRGRGGFTGLALGSVSQAMIHHAPCPVLIARHER
jgi:nucleotide-binding universal stress UspA family protein